MAPPPAQDARRDGRWDWTLVHARCLRQARALVGPGAEADDVAQEAALRAWRRRGTCRTPDAPEPWLRQIVRNEAARWFTRRRETLVEASDVAVWADRAAWSAEDSTERLTVRSALAALPAGDRELLALRYEEDLTQPAIARRLGVPEGTVKVRLHRLRKRLQADLA